MSIVELSSQPVALKCAVKTHLLQDAHAPGLRLDSAGYCSWWGHHIMSQCGTNYSILTSSSVGYRGAFLLAGTLQESLQDLVLSGPCQTPVSSTVLLAKLGYSLEPANRLQLMDFVIDSGTERPRCSFFRISSTRSVCQAATGSWPLATKFAGSRIFQSATSC